MKRKWIGVRLGLVAALAGSLLMPSAQALINPNFTPVHLVAAAKQIVQVQIDPAGEGQVAVTVIKALKGEQPAKVTLDLAKTDKVHKQPFLRAVGSGKQMGMIYLGEIQEAGDNAGGGVEDAKPDLVGRLHVGGCWFTLTRGKDGAMGVGEWSKYLNATWSSSTDMLGCVTQYVLNDREATIPCDIDTNFKPQQVGRINGKVAGMQAVDLKGDGQISLVIWSDAGDRVWQYKDKAFVDVTAQLKLTTKSLAGTWGDFDGDGRLDLASLDGKSLAIYQQAADGTFAAKLSTAQVTQCIGLAVIGDDKSPCAIVVSTSSTPILVRFKAGACELEPLGVSAGKAISDGLGEARASVVADFDGDRINDILQPFGKGAVLYKGKAGGRYEPVRLDSPATGGGRTAVGVGDFDADGLPDLISSSEEGACAIWQNVGGKFVEVMGTEEIPLSGECAYKSKSHGVAIQPCDLNNDGREDFFVAYSNVPMQVYFNRGFRSFALPQKGDPQAFELSVDGVQSAAAADLTGDGVVDLVVVLKNGDLHALAHEPGDRAGLAVRAVLPRDEKHAGPLAVRAHVGTRLLGTRYVSPGGEAFFGRTEPGEVVLKWQYPGAKEQEAKVLLEDGPVRCELGREGAKIVK